MQKFQMPSKITTTKYLFTFYDGILNYISTDIIAANIIVILKEKNGYNHITIYERNTKNEKTKICDISQEEISRIKNDIGVYIRPKKIETIYALKKAIVFYLSA